jgi:hypothetical protein
MPRKTTRPKPPAKPPRKSRTIRKKPVSIFPSPPVPEEEAAPKGIRSFIGLSKHKYLWISAILLFVLFSVLTKKTGFGIFLMKHNDEIDEKAREEIHHFDQTLLNDFSTQAFSIIKMYAPADLEKTFSEENVRDIYWKSKWFFDQKPAFNAFNDYQVTAFKFGVMTGSIPSQTDPTFTYQAFLREHENFISMMVSSEVKYQKMLCIFSYEKHGGEWKLFRIHLGIFEVNGLNAVEWAQQVQKLHDQGKEGAALLGLQVLDQFYRPDPVFQYKDEDKWKPLADDVKKACADKYHFPIALDTLPGKPLVFSAQLTLGSGGPTVFVRYRTSFKLSQTKQIEAEARSMTAPLEALLPGIELEAKQADFMATENTPDDPKGYGTLVDLTKP